MGAAIIPLKQRRICNSNLKSIILCSPDGRSTAMTCYVKNAELKALLAEGWTISPQQQSFDTWVIEPASQKVLGGNR